MRHEDGEEEGNVPVRMAPPATCLSRLYCLGVLSCCYMCACVREEPVTSKLSKGCHSHIVTERGYETSKCLFLFHPEGAPTVSNLRYHSSFPLSRLIYSSK
jgi:hypothetical protein